MKTVAEQIRALSQQIMELEDIKPVASVQAPVQAAVDPDKYKPKDKIPEVQGSSFSQAMANAIKQGLKPGDKFRWCSVYGTKIGKKRPQVDANPAQPDPFSRYGGGQNLNGSPTAIGITDRLREAVASLTTQLDEADPAGFPSLRIGDIDPRNGQKILSALTSSDGTVVRSRFGDIWNVKYGPPDAPTSVEPVKPPENVVKPPEPVKPPENVVTPPEPVKPPEEPVKPPEEDANKQPCDPETLAKIKYMPSFNQAFAAARQAGCDQFAWCGVFTVKKEQDSNPETPPAAVGNPNMFFKNVSAWIAQAQRRIGQKPHDAPYSRQEIDAVVKQIKDSGTIEWNGQAERAIRYRMQTGKPMPVLTPGQQLGPNTTFPSTFSPNK
jgi:hypothetical protein